MIGKQLLAHYQNKRFYNSYLINTDKSELAFAEVKKFLRATIFPESSSDVDPEIKIIARDKHSSHITIEQIRLIHEFLDHTSLLSEKRIVIIYEAEQMNLNAANSCLKILEDTPRNSHLILITTNAAAILPTIRSRCNLINYNYNGDNNYKPGYQHDELPDKYLKLLLKSTPVNEKLNFIKEFTNKEKNLWMEFSRIITEILNKLVKYRAGCKLNLSKSEEQLLAQFDSSSLSYLQNKYENVINIIDYTNNYELDVQNSCILLIEAFGH